LLREPNDCRRGKRGIWGRGVKTPWKPSSVEGGRSFAVTGGIEPGVEKGKWEGKNLSSGKRVKAALGEKSGLHNAC